jgi:glycyl-tRNA synthetase beta chain
MIRAGLDRAAAASGVSVVPDPPLLEEVSGLVEFPVVFAGAIDAASMALPPEVLATAMRTHQKYFSCRNADGTPAPRFLFVANTPGEEGGHAIVAGNERVLRARLADAHFFWDQDRRVRLGSRVSGLAGRVYHAGLGSMRDKARRMERLAEILVGSLGWTERLERVRTAVRLAKADLSTGMVGEFPELQGIMGRYYALNDGEDAAIATAIAEHYKPLGPGDTCPTAPESIVVALSDKIDTLAAFFAIGEKPTGSRDPFALRRAALGLIRIVLENGLALALRPTLARALEPLPNLVDDPLGDLLAFIVERVKVHLRESGVRHDLVASVFADGIEATGEDDLVRLVARIRALQSFLGTEDGANLLAGYRRAANIVAIEERRAAGTRYDGAVDPVLLREPEEHALEHGLGEVEERTRGLMGSASFAGAMAELARLRPAIDAFFDKVTVNSEEPALRENRLKLLSRIRATLNQVADFSRIEG